MWLLILNKMINNLNPDTTITNTFTLGAVGLALMNPVTALTVLSLLVAITANLVVIYKNLKDKK